MRKLLIPTALLAASLSGCVENNSAPQGLHPSRAMGGAKVLFDMNARPLPEIPFPNDVATRIDPTSPTGRRVNVSQMAPTQLEAGVREKVNQLDGFSTYGSIYVAFSEALDLHNILERHTEPVPDFRDDTVYVVNIDRDSPEYGTFTLVDLGRGNFPVTMKVPDNYFDFDPRAQGTNLLFESVPEEDENGNGILDPIEDTDDDGVWDQPNTLTPGADPLAAGQMLEFYERESNTLIIRPVEALRPGTTYAVVLTSALIDEKGLPIDSPFEFVNHTRQTAELERLRQILPKAFPERFDQSLEAVRFAWTFTTQTTTLELEKIREGMYGSGRFAWLSREFPAQMKLLHRINGEDDPDGALFARIDRLIPIMLQVLAGDLPGPAVAAMTDAYKDVDYIVSGSFVTPYFLTDKDGLAGDADQQARNLEQFDENESFQLDLATGDAAVGEDEVTWTCAVPKEKPGRKAPFPVVIYGHGYGSSRLEMLGFAGSLAKFGLASCAIDNAGHGLPVERFLDDIGLDFQPVLENIGLDHMVDVLGHGRQRDLTNDGLGDPGGDYWTADTFHTRDMVRQTTVDYMQFVRILRTWDGQKRFPTELDEDDPYVKSVRGFVAGWDTDLDGEPELAGDFNGDGVVDFGGEQPYYAWGQSLGGIQSAVLVGIDPAVRGAAPVAGGAGLADIAIRSTQGGVPEAVLLRMLGPLVLGRPLDRWNAETNTFEWTGSSQVEFLIPNSFEEQYIPIARIDGLETGDRIVVRNLERERKAHLVDPDHIDSRTLVRNGIFRTGMAADAVGTNERRKALGFDSSYDVATLHRRSVPPEQGLTQQWYLRRGLNQFVFQEKADNIDVTFAEGEAPEGFRPQEHSIRFMAALTAPNSELVSLRVEADGRAQLYLDGKRVIDARDEEGIYRLRMEEGQTYDLELRYDRVRDTGAVRLFWSSESLPETIVPASAFQTHTPLSEEERAELDKRIIENAREWGDPFVIEIYSAENPNEPKRVIDTFEMDVYYQNVLYPKGSKLAALTEGFGLARQTPAFRRFFTFAQMILDKADPAVYAPVYHEHPLTFPYEKGSFQNGTSNVLVIPTVGDTAVPVNTGISIARVAGIVDTRKYDPRYGMTQNQYLVDNYVYEAVWWLDRQPEYPETLFDPDDLDGGLFESPQLPERGADPNADARVPLRATVRTIRGVSAMRMPYLDVRGRHGFDLPKPQLPFDIDSFMVNQIGYYFATGGQELKDDPCLEELSMAGCDFFDKESWAPPTIP